MANVALQGSTITESSKSNYVSYVERYQTGSECVSRDEDGVCTKYEPAYSNATWYSNAKITGLVSDNSNRFKVNGVSVACVGDSTQEQWKADPTPYPHNGGSIISTFPSTSGSGQGSVTTGNSKKVYLNGKLIVVNGSQVTTHLGTSTTINIGDILINM